MVSSFDGVGGFTAEVTGAEARRQLRMSVGVVAMLAIGIVSAAAAIGSHPSRTGKPAASTAPAAALRAGMASGAGAV